MVRSLNLMRYAFIYSMTVNSKEILLTDNISKKDTSLSAQELTFCYTEELNGHCVENKWMEGIDLRE